MAAWEHGCNQQTEAVAQAVAEAIPSAGTQQWERYWSLQGTWAVCEVDYDVGTWLA